MLKLNNQYASFQYNQENENENNEENLQSQFSLSHLNNQSSNQLQINPEILNSPSIRKNDIDNESNDSLIFSTIIHKKGKFNFDLNTYNSLEMKHFITKKEYTELINSISKEAAEVWLSMCSNYKVKERLTNNNRNFMFIVIISIISFILITYIDINQVEYQYINNNYNSTDIYGNTNMKEINNTKVININGDTVLNAYTLLDYNSIIYIIDYSYSALSYVGIIMIIFVLGYLGFEFYKVFCTPPPSVLGLSELMNEGIRKRIEEINKLFLKQNRNICFGYNEKTQSLRFCIYLNQSCLLENKEKNKQESNNHSIRKVRIRRGKNNSIVEDEND